MKVLEIFAGLEKQKNRVDCRKGNSFSPLSCKYGVFMKSQSTRKTVYILFKQSGASIREYSPVFFLLALVTEKRGMEFSALFNSTPCTSSPGAARAEHQKVKICRLAWISPERRCWHELVQPSLHHCWSPLASQTLT